MNNVSDKPDSDAESNRKSYEKLIHHLHTLRNNAREGGSDKARQKHKERGKMLARERVDALLDPGSPFLEIADLAGEGLYDGVPPGAGIITGVGVVSERQCMIIANDPTVKGGTYFGMTCKKHVRAQKFAWENRLPVITLVDSGGAFLPDQANIFPDEGLFGSIFYNQVGMSAEGISQIAVVLGACTAGGAYIPALCDEVVIVRGQGYMYLGGPQLVQAATGETTEAEDLGGAEMHSRVSGVTDYIAENDADALAIARRLVHDLPPTNPSLRVRQKTVEPASAPIKIYELVSQDSRRQTPTRDVLKCILDAGELREFKAEFGKTLITGFAHIGGYQVGVLANDGVLFTESALKATHFIDICCKRDIPLVFFADVTGFMVGKDAEVSGIAKAGAKFITAMSSAAVPKFTIIIGGSYGAGNLAMCGRAFKPTAMFMWPNGRSAIMGPEQAATVLALVKEQILKQSGESWSEEKKELFKDPIRKEYEAFADPYNFARHLWVDGIIDPVETRPVLTLLLDTVSRLPRRETKFGVFRM